MSVTISLKTKVEKEVLDQIIQSLNNGSLTIESSQEIARETLAAVDRIEKQEQTILSFYEGLANKYKTFEILYTKIKGDLLRGHEITAYKSALNAIDSGDIESAKSIANTAIESTADEANINK